MTADQALALAEVSTCSGMGTLTGTPAYHEVTRTWWIDLTPSEPKAGCSPACVVDEMTGTAEVNWRCTGLVPPLDTLVASNLACSAPGGVKMTLGEALQIATGSSCMAKASLTDRHSCNEVTGTWWLDIEPDAPKAGCSPACVVNITGRTAEINWRCTGLKM